MGCSVYLRWIDSKRETGKWGIYRIAKVCWVDDEDWDGPMIGISEDVDEEGVELDGSP